jgi:hypothetical protein
VRNTARHRRGWRLWYLPTCARSLQVHRVLNGTGFDTTIRIRGPRARRPSRCRLGTPRPSGAGTYSTSLPDLPSSLAIVFDPWCTSGASWAQLSGTLLPPDLMTHLRKRSVVGGMFLRALILGATAVRNRKRADASFRNAMIVARPNGPVQRNRPAGMRHRRRRDW